MSNQSGIRVRHLGIWIIQPNTLDYVPNLSLDKLKDFIISLDVICNLNAIEYIHYIFPIASLKLDMYGDSSRQIFQHCALSFDAAKKELDSEVISKNGIKVLKRMVR